MNFEDITKKIVSGEKIYNLPLRVCYYCRVSTDSDVQLNSLDNQLEYYKNYILSKKNWTFVDGYIEDGVSGVRVDKRTGFKKMIRDAKEHKFDLIITKEVSRFARDLEDSIHYIRELKDSNVGVFFENQNLNTFDPNSEMILNIMFNIAQDESRKLSSRVKFGHRQAIKNGHVLGSSNITGYKKENCKLVIVPEEAKFIRLIYELYSTGEYGFYKLAKKLDKLGYRNKRGKIYDKDTLKRMIENPKYKGFYRANQYEIVDYRTKKRKKNPVHEQILYKCDDGSIPAIVSEEIWNKANNILKIRTSNYKNNNYSSGGVKYPFSSKMYCKNDNTNYQRSHGTKSKNRPTWCCGNYLKYRLDACCSPIIGEEDLYNIFRNILNKIMPKKNIIVNNLLKIYNNIEHTNEYEEELLEINNKIKKIEDKKSLALDLVLNGELAKELLKVQFEKLEEELKRLNNKRVEIIKQIKVLNDNYKNIDKISDVIKNILTNDILEDFIRTFLDEVIIQKINENRNNIKMDIFLNLNGEKKVRKKGANHINGPLDEEKLFIDNQKCNTMEIKRKNDIPNKYTYSVYLEP